MHISIEQLAPHKWQFQIATFALAFLGFILAIIRLALPGAIPSRLQIWVLVVCLKSMIILSYEILTERSTRCQRWASTKANAILNCIEPVFWLAAFVLTAMGISSGCRAAACAIGAFLMMIALALVPITLALAFIAIREHRARKSRVQPSRKQEVV